MGVCMSSTGKERVVNSRPYPEIYKEKYGGRPMKEVLEELKIQHANVSRAYNALSEKESDAIRAIEESKQKEYEEQNGVKTVLGHNFSKGETYLCLPEKSRLIVEFVYSDKIRLRGGKEVVHREHFLAVWKTPVLEKCPEKKRLDSLMSALWQEICDMRIWA